MAVTGGIGAVIVGQTTSSESTPVVLASDQSALTVTSSTYATRVDEASSTVTYVGKAVPGTLDANALWQISRMTQSGSVLLIEYANGSSSFNQIWDDRASLSYS